MGANTRMLVYSKGEPKELLGRSPSLDRAASIALARQLFAAEKLQSLDDGDLSLTCPPDDEIVVGCYPGLIVVAAKECAVDHPSKLDARFIDVFSDGVLPYWAGSHPALDADEDDADYPLPFHPLELGDVALHDFFGYLLEGVGDSSRITPGHITLLRFKRKKGWWPFW